jgi:hypothetical protein
MINAFGSFDPFYYKKSITEKNQKTPGIFSNLGKFSEEKRRFSCKSVISDRGFSPSAFLYSEVYCFHP